MKKLFILLLLFYSASCFSQQTTPPEAMTKSDYLAKAKKQNTAGWTMLGGGFLINTVGIIVGAREVENDIYNLFRLEETRKTYAGGILLIIGGATMLGSIPFFVASANNRRKANSAPLSLQFKMESQTVVRQASMNKSSYPAIALRIRL